MTVALALALAQAMPGASSGMVVRSAPAPRDLESLKKFANCLVVSGPGRAARAIDRYLASDNAEETLAALAQEKSACMAAATDARSMGRRVQLRTTGPLLAGFIAERLVVDDLGRGDPGAATAYDRTKPSVAARSESEAVGLCMGRRRPADVWALIRTRPASTEEGAVIARLVPELAGCTAQGAQAKFSKPGLRAILALAFRRLVLANRG